MALFSQLEYAVLAILFPSLNFLTSSTTSYSLYKEKLIKA